MPTVQKVHIDKVLSNISTGYKNEQFIADQIFLPVTVDKQSDRYYEYGKEMFRANDDKRAPGTEANEINWTLSLNSYYTEGHALRSVIPDEEKQNADSEFNLEADATELTTEGILLNKEIDAAAKVMSTSSYADSTLKPTMLSTTTGAAFEKWNLSTSNPIRDIETAKLRVHKFIGLKPNTLVISEAVLSALRQNAKVLAVYKTTERSLATLEDLKAILNVENILVGSALKSSATTPTGSDTLEYIWGDNAALIYVPKKAGKKIPAFGYSFMWNKDGAGAVQVRSWYEQSRRATVIESERWYAQAVVSSYAGVLFSSVLN